MLHMLCVYDIHNELSQIHDTHNIAKLHNSAAQTAASPSVNVLIDAWHSVNTCDHGCSVYLHVTVTRSDAAAAE